jgi:hypothetical protein
MDRNALATSMSWALGSWESLVLRVVGGDELIGSVQVARVDDLLEEPADEDLFSSNRDILPNAGYRSSSASSRSSHLGGLPRHLALRGRRGSHPPTRAAYDPALGPVLAVRNCQPIT